MCLCHHKCHGTPFVPIDLLTYICNQRAGKDGLICRDSVSGNSNPGLSRFQEATLGQGRIEEHLLKFIEGYSNVQIRWQTIPTSLRLHKDMLNDSHSHAVEVQLRPSPDPDKQQSAATLDGDVKATIYARYLIGCDGARSWVRKQLNLSLEGSSSQNSHWGVVDCVPVTNFR